MSPFFLRIFQNSKSNFNVKLPNYLNLKTKPFNIYHCLNDKIKNKFSGMDSEECFNKNLETMPSDWHYRTKEIEYLVNSDGYRTYEWKDINWPEAIVIFGCSCTFGVGLAQDETLPYYLEKLTGRQTVNLGVGGGSNEVMLNNCAAMINHFELPYAVIFNWTDMKRFRYYKEKSYEDIGRWSKNNIGYDLLKLMSSDPYHINSLNYLNLLEAKALLKNRSKFFNVTFFKETNEVMGCENFFDYMENKDYARDRIHPGKDSMLRMAKYIASTLEFKKL